MAAGSADTGLGVLTAARSLGLDFIPLARERYDLAVPLAYLEDAGVSRLLAVVRSDEFRRALADLGGYHTGNTGREIYRTKESG